MTSVLHDEGLGRQYILWARVGGLSGPVLSLCGPTQVLGMASRIATAGAVQDHEIRGAVRGGRQLRGLTARRGREVSESPQNSFPEKIQLSLGTASIGRGQGLASTSIP